jgi:hypothetical protein
MESHNHPSFIEPYQGAATGVGGILRDVFTMGARPIANLDSLRFGRPDHPRTPALVRGVVAGVGGYGNCIGVPTVGGELFFDRAYDGNILVNAFTCGTCRTDRIFHGRASGVGNPVIYVGARTGRDGIHGAAMASDEFSNEGPSQPPVARSDDGRSAGQQCRLAVSQRDLRDERCAARDRARGEGEGRCLGQVGQADGHADRVRDDVRARRGLPPRLSDQAPEGLRRPLHAVVHVLNATILMALRIRRFMTLSS